MKEKLPIKINIPAGFLDEEIRCEYIVTSNMKKIWAVEIDLLVELLRVCKKNSIKIFASGGTLLGAVRHKGMIPWDDDIDMMMYREDYKKLCKVAPLEFQFPYFFQTEYTDPGSLRGHAQLRNSMTTAILMEEQKYAKFNQGIFIDIFPLDTVVNDENLFKKQYKTAKSYKEKALRYSRLSTRYAKYTAFGWKEIIKKMIHPFANALIQVLHLEEKAYKKFENTCERYNHLRTEKISTLSLEFNNKQHFKFREDFEDIIDIPFEFIDIPVGKLYDHALRQRYGNYKQIVKGTNLHGNIIFDTEKDYKHYINEQKIH